MERRIQTFREFWPYYVGEHSHPLNRALHFIGSSLVLATLATAIVTQRAWLFALLPVIGYGFAWVGHFFVEKNRPATFKYPLWSFASDWVMWFKILTGRMGDEVRAAAASSSTPL
jgi:hypothetical protein